MIRRFRVPASQLVLALMDAALLLLVGLSALTEPWRKVGVGDVIMPVLAGGAGVYAAAVALTTHVTLTPAEISYRANHRSAAIRPGGARGGRRGEAVT